MGGGPAARGSPDQLPNFYHAVWTFRNRKFRVGLNVTTTTKRVVNFWGEEKCTLRENPGYAYEKSPPPDPEWLIRPWYAWVRVEMCHGRWDVYMREDEETTSMTTVLMCQTTIVLETSHGGVRTYRPPTATRPAPPVVAPANSIANKFPVRRRVSHHRPVSVMWNSKIFWTRWLLLSNSIHCALPHCSGVFILRFPENTVQRFSSAVSNCTF